MCSRGISLRMIGGEWAGRGRQEAEPGSGFPLLVDPLRQPIHPAGKRSLPTNELQASSSTPSPRDQPPAITLSKVESPNSTEKNSTSLDPTHRAVHSVRKGHGKSCMDNLGRYSRDNEGDWGSRWNTIGFSPFSLPDQLTSLLVYLPSFSHVLGYHFQALR